MWDGGPLWPLGLGPWGSGVGQRGESSPPTSCAFVWPPELVLPSSRPISLLGVRSGKSLPQLALLLGSEAPGQRAWGIRRGGGKDSCEHGRGKGATAGGEQRQRVDCLLETERRRPRQRQEGRGPSTSLDRDARTGVGGTRRDTSECALSPTEYMQMRPVCMQMSPSVCR